MKYTTNRDLLKQWIKNEKAKSKNPASVETALVDAVGISTVTLRNLLYAKDYFVGKQTRLLLAQHTKIKIGLLFNAIEKDEAA